MTCYKCCFRFFASKNTLHFLPTALTQNARKLDQVYQHDFNHQLFDGILKSDSWGYYLRDDYYYLHQYASILEKIAQKIRPIKPELAQHLSYLAQDIINNELTMQIRYQEHLSHIANHQPGKAISDYIKHLSGCMEAALSAEENLPTALSALLPCFWIYSQLGSMHTFKPMNPYHEWIATYTDPAFVSATQQLAEATAHLYQSARAEIRSKMLIAFGMSVRCELAFFNEVMDYEHTLLVAP